MRSALCLEQLHRCCRPSGRRAAQSPPVAARAQPRDSATDDGADWRSSHDASCNVTRVTMQGMIGALAAHADCVASIEQTHFLGTLLLYLKGRNAQPSQKSTAVPFLEKISAESVREYQLQVSHSMMYCVCGTLFCCSEHYHATVDPNALAHACYRICNARAKEYITFVDTEHAVLSRTGDGGSVHRARRPGDNAALLAHGAPASHTAGASPSE